MQRLRRERVELSFAHVCDRGGTRRLRLRGFEKVRKRYLVAVLAHNLGLVMRKLWGWGTPRALAAALHACLTTWLLRSLMRWQLLLRLPYDFITTPCRAAFSSTGCYLVLAEKDAKYLQRAEAPLRADLTADLANWIAEESAASSTQTLPIQKKLRPLTAERLFRVPQRLVKALDRDLAAAGIPKVDDRGRSIGVHALRHSFGSLLSAGGVAPRTAQAAMRHSNIDLTMNVYTDPRVLDVAGALDALPALPLNAQPVRHREQQATGTDRRQLTETWLLQMLHQILFWRE